MLSLSPEWIAAASRPTSRPIFRVQFKPGYNGVGFYFTTGPHLYSDHRQIVTDVSQVTGKVDVKNRKFEIGEVTISLLDEGLVRDIFVIREPKNCYVDIKIGFHDLEAQHFAPYFTGTVFDIDTADLGAINIHCRDRTYRVIEKSVEAAGWMCAHPLDAIVGLLRLSGVDDSDIVLSDFDPETAGGGKYKHVRTTPGTEVEKWRVWNGTSLEKQTRNYGPIKGEVRKEIESLASIVHASIFVDEYGRVRCRIFDPDAAVVSHIEEHDLISFDQVSTYEDLSNHLAVTQTSHTIEKDKDAKLFDMECVFEDKGSQEAFAEPGKDEFIASTVKELKYTGQHGETTSRWWTPGANYPHIQDLGNGFINLSGTLAVDGPPGALGTSSSTIANNITEEHPIYIQIQNDILKLWNPVDPIEWQGDQTTTDGRNSQYTLAAVRKTDNFTPSGEHISECHFPQRIRFGDWENGLFGSANLSYEDFGSQEIGTTFSDVTAAVHWAEGYFDRFGHGCPIINIEIPLKYYYLQIGDIITVDESKTFYFKNENYLDDRTAFEIVSKETSASPNGTHIKIMLAFVRRDNLPTGPMSVTSTKIAFDPASDIQNQIEPHIDQGMAVSGLPGLEVEIDLGEMSGGGFGWKFDDTSTFPVYRNADSYMFASAKTGAIGALPVETGGDAPEPPEYSTFIAKITAGEEEITTIEDLRTFTPFSGSQIEPGSGPLTHLDSDGSFTGPLDAAQISNLPDLSALPALDTRVGAIENDYATSGDIPDVSNFITDADLPDHSQFATTTALAAVSTVVDGAIQSGQEQVTVKDINEKTSGLDDGLIPNPSFYQFDQNGYPTHWYTWNTDNASDPNDNSTINIVDGNSTRGRYSVHINGSRFPDGSSPQTPVLLTKGCNVGYSDHLRVEVHCGATTPDTMNASWGVTVYYYYCLPDGGIYYTGGNTGMTYGSDQFVSGAATLGGGFQPRLFSLKIKPQGDQWWIDKANAISGSYPDAINYLGYPIEARFSFRQTNIVNDKYGFKVCYFNAHRVGNNVKDWDSSTVQYIADINTTAVAAQTTADNALPDQTDVIKNSHLDNYIVSATNLTSSCSDRLVPNGHTGVSVLASVNAAATAASSAQSTADAATTAASNAQGAADAAAASHYALAELELRPADVPSGGWNDEIIIVCPTMLAMSGGGDGFYTP